MLHNEPTKHMINNEDDDDGDGKLEYLPVQQPQQLKMEKTKRILTSAFNIVESEIIRKRLLLITTFYAIYWMDIINYLMYNLYDINCYIWSTF